MECREYRWIRPVTVALLLFAAAAPVQAQTAMERTPSFKELVRFVGNPTTGEPSGDGGLVAGTGDVLLHTSPTFFEMMVAVRGARNMSIYIYPSRLRGLYGRGRFDVVRGHLVGLIELQSGAASEEDRVHGLAHELAHAYEVLCLPRRGSTEEIRAQLAERARRYANTRSLETPFPHAVELRVFHERYGRGRKTSLLAVIAEQYGLTECAGQKPLEVAAEIR
jgi:hypothetical protein